ncbi:MAG: protein kinase [Gemmatimonadales bacterium]
MARLPSDLARALAGRYALEREVGRGGMATVYLAEDLKHARWVALKVLRPELARSLGTERFLREIRIAANLSHPHILPLLDSGEAGNHLYYVIPHVKEGSLRERLDRDAALPLEEALRILREIGGALDYAHRQGFVHRDVKPENILFMDKHAMLADFGIARVTSTSGGDAITEIGLVLGTPEYMSPEQAAGDREIGAPSDIYSLACVAFEMLAGTPPLLGESARATIAKQVTEAPRPVRALRPDVPGNVERALTRALAKDPGERFATAAHLVLALEREEPGAVLRSIAARSIAVLPFVNASPDPENEYLSDGITDELIHALAKVDGLRVASRTSVFALKGKPADVRAIGALLGAAWVLEGTMRRAGTRLRVTAQLTSTEDGRLLWSQTFDRTFEDVFTIQEDIARTIVDTLRTTSFAELAAPAAQRRTKSVAAYGLYLKGRYAWNKRTQDGIVEAIGYFERAIAEDPDYPQAYAGLADSYALSLDYRSVPVAEGFARAKEYARKALELDETVAETHASLAWSLFIYDWDWEASRREFRRAIELDPGYATARQWYSFWLASQGHHAESLAEVHRAHELDPASVSIRRSVGWVYYYARRLDEARYYMERAIAVNPTSDESYRVLGLAHAMRNDWTEAEAALREAVALSNGGWYNRAALGYVLARSGRKPEAEALRRELEEHSRHDYVSPIALATVDIGLEYWDSAFEQIERGYAERRGWLAYLRVHPIVDPLRGDPRFKSLLEKMKL